MLDMYYDCLNSYLMYFRKKNVSELRFEPEVSSFTLYRCTIELLYYNRADIHLSLYIYAFQDSWKNQHLLQRYIKCGDFIKKIFISNYNLIK